MNITFEAAIVDECNHIINTPNIINQMIADYYDSRDHETPFDVKEKNRIKQLILNPPRLREYAIKHLTETGIITVDH